MVEPWGLKVNFKDSTMSAAPVFNESDLSFRIGNQGLTEFFGKAPVIVYLTGSVPALSSIPDAGGPNVVCVGIQKSDGNFHAENEYMRFKLLARSIYILEFASCICGLIE